MSSLIGRTIGQYEVTALLGHGGMATVYRARQASVGRDVAVKFLPEALAADGALRERFAQEARTIANLQHPHILPLFDYGESDGLPYLVMRLLEGGSLEDRLQRGRLDQAETLRLIEQIAAALDFAHARQVVHRDLKPANILLDAQGEAYLSDFGIAKLLSATGGLTGSGLIGTPLYMAPEQIQGRVDARVDVYALGVVAYQLLTGEAPFSGDTYEVLTRKLAEPPRRPADVDPDFSPPLERVLLKALAPDPDLRYAAAGEFARELRAAMALAATAPTHEAVAAPTLGAPTRPVAPVPAAPPTVQASHPRPSARWLRVGALLGAAALAGAGLWLGGAALLTPPAASTPPPRVTGEFNIAVAEFTREGNLPPDAGQIVAAQVFRRIDTGVAQASAGGDVDYQLWSFEQVGRVEGASPEARAEAAAQLAADLGAQIVVYGVARDAAGLQTVEPAFYVSEAAFVLAPEFLGVHRLGGEIVLSGGADFAERVQTNRAIADRSQALGFMAVALEKYALAEYASALDWFTQAAALEGWPDDDGKEAVYLMSANTALRLDRLEDAETFLRRALALNPGYARAFVGLGSVYYQRALGLPRVQRFEDINQADLDLAEQTYGEALVAPDRPGSAEIGVKVSLGLGQAAYVRYQITRDPAQLRLAQAQFQTVVETYANTQSQRIREHAGQAHAQLGNMAFFEGDLARAESEYRAALEAVRIPRAVAAYHALLADVYRAQNRLNEARAELQAALAVAPFDARAQYQRQLDEVNGTKTP